MLKSGIAAAVVGLFYGGLPAARHARLSYIQNSQAEIYTSRVDAVVGERRQHQALKAVFSFDCTYTVLNLQEWSFSFLCLTSESAFGS